MKTVLALLLALSLLAPSVARAEEPDLVDSEAYRTFDANYTGLSPNESVGPWFLVMVFSFRSESDAMSFGTRDEDAIQSSLGRNFYDCVQIPRRYPAGLRTTAFRCAFWSGSLGVHDSTVIAGYDGRFAVLTVGFDVLGTVMFSTHRDSQEAHRAVKPSSPWGPFAPPDPFA